MASAVFLRLVRQTIGGQEEVLFSLKNDSVTATVLLILGACMFIAGAYLILGGIGTIPASIGGSFLILASLAAISTSIVKFFKY